MVAMVFLMAIGGLVLDGARAESAHITAMNEAAAAARAGAAVLGTAPRQATVDPAAAAVAAAESWMASDGHPGTATVSGDVVRASVAAYRVPTTLLSIVGINHFDISATASASPSDGASP